MKFFVGMFKARTPSPADEDAAERQQHASANARERQRELEAQATRQREREAHEEERREFQASAAATAARAHGFMRGAPLGVGAGDSAPPSRLSGRSFAERVRERFSEGLDRARDVIDAWRN